VSASLLALGRSDLPALSRMLGRIERSDPYSVSAGYFALTGRRGLWLYGDDRTVMVICRHPNRAERLLLFPPFGAERAGLIEEALGEARLPAGRRDLARVAPEDAPVAAGFGMAQREDVLDWAHPVHVLDVRTVSAHTGDRFRDFRKNLNRAARAELWARPLDLVRDRYAIMGVAEGWATSHGGPRFSHGDLMAPTRAALSLWGVLPIAGVGVFHAGRMIGFALWEESREKGRIAYGLTSLTFGNARGASEFLYQAMCAELMAKGFGELCIGGSETASLDAFKRKMQPCRSVVLRSVRNVGRSSGRAAVPARHAA